jgi:hypothetical protein
MRINPPFTPNARWDHKHGINLWNSHTVTGLNLMNNFDHNRISKICIINGPQVETVKNKVDKLDNFSVEVFTSFNLFNNVWGVDESIRQNTEISKIACPPKYKNLEWINHVKLMNHNMDYDQVTRILDHMIIWHHCIVGNEPVILLENNANPHALISNHFPRNSVISLSADSEYYYHSDNWVCMKDVSCYGIDPFSANALFNEVMRSGIINPIDLMFRIDKQNVVPVQRLLDQVQK